MDKQKELEYLKSELERVLFFLRQDIDCRWTSRFEKCLSNTKYLLKHGHDKSLLIDLQQQITDVFGGMGSFNDYCPPKHLCFVDINGDLFNAALALR